MSRARNMSTATPPLPSTVELAEKPVRSDVRNIAIIAHVDHGKTTLVDGFLRQAGSFRPGEVVADCAMDSNELERERGITILAKFTAITWKGMRINIVDTPGHADFGGEVERVLKMVDSVCLLVDAYEGPMPQTRFVTRKALALGLRPILVVNKVDRPGCDPEGDRRRDLRSLLRARRHRRAARLPDRLRLGPRGLGGEGSQGRAQGPRAAARPGFGEGAAAGRRRERAAGDERDHARLRRLPGLRRHRPRRIRARAPGRARAAVHRDGSREDFRVAKILGYQALKRFELAEAAAGDICAITGMQDLTVGETITEPLRPIVLPLLDIEEPTVQMQFISNNGPFAGTEGKFVTSRNLRDRLLKEVKSNVALRVKETESPDTFEVAGRGELHLTVLIETMRREGYELMVSQPRVIFKEGPDGEKLEPYEEVVIDVDEAYSGAVIEELGRRGGRMQEMGPAGEGRMRLEYLCPARGLIGYRSQFLTDTRGTGIIHHNFKNYGPYAGTFKARINGVLISQDAGDTNAYGLFYLQERGQLFIGPEVKVYGGQIIGLHSRDNDLDRQPVEGEEADQHPHHRRRREADPAAAARVHAGVGNRVHQRRRAGRVHAQGDPPAQARARPQRAQARREAARRRRQRVHAPARTARARLHRVFAALAGADADRLVDRASRRSCRRRSCRSCAAVRWPGRRRWPSASLHDDLDADLGTKSTT